MINAKNGCSGATFLIIAVFLIFHGTAYPAAEGQFEAEGFAQILEGRKDLARENSLNNAFRRVVEQALGVRVEARTIVKNFELLNDKVYSRSAGYIKKYAIVDEKIEGDTYRIKITADVSTRKLIRDINDVIKAAGKPRILMLIAEQDASSDKPSSWLGPGNMNSLGITENTLVPKFIEKGFTFVDRQAILNIVRDDPSYAKNSASGLADDMVLKLASEGEAELIIIGQAVAKAGPAISGTSMRSCLANISVRVITADNGETVTSLTTKAASAHVDPATGGAEALRSAATEMSRTLTSQILSKWESKIIGTRMVKLVVNGLSFGDVSAFKEFIKDEIEDIEEIYDRSYKEDVSRLDIESRVSAKELAEYLSKITFNESMMEVTSLTSNVIQVRLKTRQ